MHNGQSSGRRLPEGATTLVEAMMTDNQYNGSDSDTRMIAEGWSYG